MLEIRQENEKYEKTMIQMERLFIDNPLYDFVSRREEFNS